MNKKLKRIKIRRKRIIQNPDNMKNFDLLKYNSKIKKMENRQIFKNAASTKHH